MHRYLKSGFLITSMLLSAVEFTSGQSSETIKDQYVEATLVSEVAHILPGTPFRVGLLLKHETGWHTYWKSSATGYATSIEWDLPDGFSAGEIEWPAPGIYKFLDWTEFVYDGDVLLMTTITPPKQLPEGKINLGFTAEWLMCKDVCIPGGVSSVLELPVSNQPVELSPKWRGLFASAEAELPVAPQGLRMLAWRNGQSINLQIEGDSLPETVIFFDDQAATRPESGYGMTGSKAGTLQLTLAVNTEREAFPERLSGVLSASGGWPGLGNAKSISIDFPISKEPPAVAAKEPISWSAILGLAFLGGLILNLMPCVFPVLGIKIMGFVNQAGESRGKVAAHGLTFSAGVLLSFWLLAIVLLLLRSGGNQLGWGFQLQSPGFVIALTLLLFGFGLNMSGLFEFGQSAIGVGSRLTGKGGFAGSFFSGVLATVVATPCAAPFLAPALGAALALPPFASMTVFTFIAIGLATPYLVLSSFPSMVNWLPKPGAWMETFKQFMGFLLYTTVAYLVWVLAGQLTDNGGYGGFALLKVLLSLVLLALGLWIFGRWATFHRPRRARLTASLVSLFVLGLSIGIGFSSTKQIGDKNFPVQWEEWAPGKAAQLASEGRTVYVDFTARWCVTCQTNKAAVFSSSDLLKTMTERDVVLLKADWTNRDSRISNALAAYNRSAVPFNLVYGPAVDSPIVLPEILTAGTVKEAILKAAGK